MEKWRYCWISVYQFLICFVFLGHSFAFAAVCHFLTSVSYVWANWWSIINPILDLDGTKQNILSINASFFFFNLWRPFGTFEMAAVGCKGQILISNAQIQSTHACCLEDDPWLKWLEWKAATAITTVTFSINLNECTMFTLLCCSDANQIQIHAKTITLPKNARQQPFL